MAKYGSADASISVGGQDISDTVEEIGEVVPEALIEEITGISQGWQHHAPVGVKKGSPFTVTCKADDDSGSAYDTLKSSFGTEVAVAIVVGGTSNLEFQAIVTKAPIRIVRNQLSVMVAELVPTGEIEIDAA